MQIETGTFPKASQLTSTIFESSSEMPTQNKGKKINKQTIFPLKEPPKCCLIQLKSVICSPLTTSAQLLAGTWQICVGPASEPLPLSAPG